LHYKIILQHCYTIILQSEPNSVMSMKKNLRFNRILMKKISFKRTLYATLLVLLSTTVFAQFMDASNERVKIPFNCAYKKMGNLKTHSTNEVIAQKNKLDLFHWISSL
jgi:hypothetical protein